MWILGLKGLTPRPEGGVNDDVTLDFDIFH